MFVKVPSQVGSCFPPGPDRIGGTGEKDKVEMTHFSHPKSTHSLTLFPLKVLRKKKTVDAVQRAHPVGLRGL